MYLPDNIKLLVFIELSVKLLKASPFPSKLIIGGAINLIKQTVDHSEKLLKLDSFIK